MPATSFGANLRRRVRVRRGNQQLAALGLPLAEGPLRLGALVDLLRTRRVGPVDAGCYLALVAADRVRVRWGRIRRTEVSWGTDSTSRVAPAPGRG